MRHVVIESPYAGDVPANIAYAKRALLDSLARGEAPLASHLLYTQVLDDAELEQRTQGIEAGHAWLPKAERVVFYMDRGMSEGMHLAYKRAKEYGLVTEYRWLDGGPNGPDSAHRHAANKELVYLLAAYFDAYPNIRFCQALENLGIMSGSVDRYHEEPGETLKRARDSAVVTSLFVNSTYRQFYASR